MNPYREPGKVNNLAQQMLAISNTADIEAIAAEIYQRILVRVRQSAEGGHVAADVLDLMTNGTNTVYEAVEKLLCRDGFKLTYFSLSKPELLVSWGHADEDEFKG